MGSSFHYQITAGFRAISQWQESIVRNAQGLLQPGYNNEIGQLGTQGGSGADAGQKPTEGAGGRNARADGGGGTLRFGVQGIAFRQGMVEPVESSTSFAVRGEGFFVLAENLRPGARLFLTRAGDFNFDAQGRLVNAQGLFVVGGGGRLTDPPTPVLRNAVGGVNLPDLSLGQVSSRSQLGFSGYGNTVYQVTDASGPLRVFANGRAEVGFVQAGVIEMPDRIGAGAILQTQVVTALQNYKMFKDMLDNFNKSVDDALGVVK